MSDQNPHNCSDGGCVFKVRTRPRGMGTNGGCKCLPRVGQTVFLEECMRLRKAVLWMKEEIERLDTALRGEHRKENQ